jgi:hypothetical protein
MPDAFYRLLAYPTGIAMIALGYSLWRTAQETSTDLPVGTFAAEPIRTAAGG